MGRGEGGELKSFRQKKPFNFFRPPLLYVFGCCDLIRRLTEILRTIFELADYPIYRSVVIDVFRWLHHA